MASTSDMRKALKGLLAGKVGGLLEFHLAGDHDQKSHGAWAVVGDEGDGGWPMQKEIDPVAKWGRPTGSYSYINGKDEEVVIDVYPGKKYPEKAHLYPANTDQPPHPKTLVRDWAPEDSLNDPRFLSRIRREGRRFVIRNEKSGILDPSLFHVAYRAESVGLGDVLFDKDNMEDPNNRIFDLLDNQVPERIEFARSGKSGSLKTDYASPAYVYKIHNEKTGKDLHVTIVMMEDSGSPGIKTMYPTTAEPKYVNRAQEGISMVTEWRGESTREIVQIPKVEQPKRKKRKR